MDTGQPLTLALAFKTSLKKSYSNTGWIVDATPTLKSVNEHKNDINKENKPLNSKINTYF